MGIHTNTQSPTIRVDHIAPGMVLDFRQQLIYVAESLSINLGEAEVISVESPDGLGDDFGIWVSPEDNVIPEVYVQAWPGQSFKIAG